MDEQQKNLDNEILNELKQLNKNTYNLISLMKAREEDRLKDKQTQATKDSEQATLDSEQAVKTAESLEAEKVKQEADELQDKQRHAELFSELKKTSEAVGKMNLSEDQADVLEEVKSVNKNLQTVIEQQDSSTLVQENSFSLGTLAFAGFLFCIGAYAVLKLGGFVYSEITKKVFR